MSYIVHYYCLRFLYAFSLSFTKTTFYLYLHLKQNLPHDDILFIFAVFNIAVMILEIPTSALGEWLGYRTSFLAGMFLKICAALGFFYGSAFWHFCCAEILSAWAVSLVSGTLNAWVMNQISTAPQKHSSTVPNTSFSASHVFMVGKRLGTVALALGGVIGAILANYDLGYPWLCVALGAFITLVISLIILEDTPTKHDIKIKHRKWNWKTAVEGYRVALSNKILLVLIWDSFLLGIALASPRTTWIPSLKSHFGKDMWFIAHMWLCITGIQFLGTFGLHRFWKWAQSGIFLKFLFVLQCLLALAGLCIPNIYTFIIFYLLIEWSSPYQQTLTLTLVQQETTPEGRLTILSLENLAGKLGDTIGLIIAGGLSGYYEIWGIWAVCVCLYATIVPCYSFLLQSNSQRYLEYGK